MAAAKVLSLLALLGQKCDRPQITCFTSKKVQILARQKVVEHARRDRPRAEGMGVFDVC